MRRSPSAPPFIRIALAFALALLFVCLGAPARAQIAAPPQRQMPDVVGLTFSEAAGRLRQFGLSVTTRQVASAQPQGTVITQSPQAGTVIRQGQTATLEVSTGQAPQDPRTGGQTDGGRTRETEGGVDVRVTPPRVGLVPDLMGMPLRMARLRLLTAGLVSGAVDSAWVEGAQGGRVVAQDPNPGTQALPGTRVRLTLAQRTPPGVQRDTQRPRDPQPDPRPADVVTVPNLNGLTLDQARVAVGRARLLLGEADSSATGTTTPGTVFAQRPAAGESVAPGTFVTVTVTRWQMTSVPAVVGRPLADAQRILRAADLRVGATTEREDQGTAGRVLTQSIPARTTVARGTRVDLAVSRAPVLTPVDSPVVATDPVVPAQRDTPTRTAQQDSPAVTQPDQTPAGPATDTAGLQPGVVDQQPVVPARTETQTTSPARVTPPTPRANVPERGGVPREVVWGALALLLLVAAYGAWRILRRGGEGTVQPPVAAAPPPVSGAVRLRVGTGGWEPATQADEPMQRARIQLNVRIADPQPSTEHVEPALGAARVAVRTVAAPPPAMQLDGGSPLRQGAAVQVRVRDDEPTLAVDNDTPVILSRRS
ncbi:MAG TPA: PASTA domain-containing protein [Longimicrobium sp.]|nr:PASTA domain-containing protein [Longimicrobium sp.]